MAKAESEQRHVTFLPDGDPTDSSRLDVGQPALPLAPPQTDREVGREVLAVLAIGVVPYLSGAIVVAVHGPSPPVPYWLAALDLCAHSAAVSYAVLYLISRSGEPFSAFGIARPRHSDLWFGLFLFMIDQFLTRNVWPFLPPNKFLPDQIFASPQGVLDYLLLPLKNAANGLAEELVMRAYLITRFERLLKSRFYAVLLSAALFASYHVYYGIGGGPLYIFLLGLAYGGMYLLLRRLWPFAIAHMLVDIFIELQY